MYLPSNTYVVAYLVTEHTIDQFAAAMNADPYTAYSERELRLVRSLTRQATSELITAGLIPLI